jgi:hypothetical protein
MNLPLSSYISSLISEACRQTFKEYQKVDKPCGFFVVSVAMPLKMTEAIALDFLLFA